MHSWDFGPYILTHIYAKIWIHLFHAVLNADVETLHRASKGAGAVTHSYGASISGWFQALYHFM